LAGSAGRGAAGATFFGAAAFLAGAAFFAAAFLAGGLFIFLFSPCLDWLLGDSATEGWIILVDPAKEDWNHRCYSGRQDCLWIGVAA
jgi:hypothetical protein